MSGRKIDASPSAGRAPRSGPGVDSRDRIVIGNGDIADDCLPANDITVVALRERSYGKQQHEQHCTCFLHWILILSVVVMFTLGLARSDQLPLPEYEIAESAAWTFR